MFGKRKTAAQVWLDRCQTTASIREAVRRTLEGSAGSAATLERCGPAAIPPLFVAAALAGVHPRAVAGDAVAAFGPPALDRLRHLEMLARRGDRSLKAGVRAALQTQPQFRGRPADVVSAATDQILRDLRHLALDALRDLQAGEG